MTTRESTNARTWNDERAKIYGAGYHSGFEAAIWEYKNRKMETDSDGVTWATSLSGDEHLHARLLSESNLNWVKKVMAFEAAIKTKCAKHPDRERFPGRTICIKCVKKMLLSTEKIVGSFASLISSYTLQLPSRQQLVDALFCK
jgi:hypothetical protein